MKTVLITGCTRGLGLEMARYFRGKGTRVLGCGRSPRQIETLASEFGEQHDFAEVDVSNDETVSSWALRILKSGTPDLLINNAAYIAPNAPLWDVTREDFDRVIDVNIKGVANVLRHFVPAMVQRRKGVIVNFSSGWGRSASSEVAAYCASKWAIEGMTQSLAQELPEGMAAVALNPGIIDTEMLRSCFGEGAGGYPKASAWIRLAGPFLEGLGPADNGGALTVPGVSVG
ncbi:3-oxoacyl-[acyl-carrier-protein] reductase [soil metagenome]